MDNKIKKMVTAASKRGCLFAEEFKSHCMSRKNNCKKCIGKYECYIPSLGIDVIFDLIQFCEHKKIPNLYLIPMLANDLFSTRYSLAFSTGKINLISDDNLFAHAIVQLITWFMPMNKCGNYERLNFYLGKDLYLKFPEQPNNIMCENITNYKDDSVESLKRYMDKGWNPGGFLTSVLANDLKNSFLKAHLHYRKIVFTYVDYIDKYLPNDIYGSYEKVNTHIFRKISERR